MTTDKPVLRCFMVMPLGVDPFDGRLRHTDIVIISLEAAEYFKDLGWWILGPDPNDCIDLAAWEREHHL
jgi:hypothetical protein